MGVLKGGKPFSRRAKRWFIEDCPIVHPPDDMPKLLPKIVPHLWFDKEAVEAARFYCSVFPDSEILNITTLRDTPSGDCDVVSFQLAGQPFMAISAGPLFQFNEAVSLMIWCETQEEMDYYTGQLSAHPEDEQCGWIKDRYGLSWQITAVAMAEMFQHGSAEQIRRVTQVMLGMRRIDLKELQAAFAES